MEIVFAFLIAIGASIIGGICGVGGGVLMKPLLDMFGIASVSTASFLSSMTVLGMTGYTTAKNLLSKNNVIETKTVLPLAIGAAAGGVIGKYLFETIKSGLSYADKIGAIQAVFLGVVAFGTAVYTINKSKIKTMKINSPAISALMGILLGLMSSFLGIGGGPIDLLVLFYFFSMETKIAAQNSLFIILFSQLFGLIYTLCANKVPEFEPAMLVLMILGGVLGGIIGKKICKQISSQKVERLFIILLIIIVFICIYNFMKYI